MPAIERSELLAIVKLALHLARADDAVSLPEKHLLAQLLQSVQPSAEERAGLRPDDGDWQPTADAVVSPAGRELLIKILCAVSHSDGLLHFAEARLVQAVNEHLGRPVELPPWESWMNYENEVLTLLGRA
jgi:uncharacterized tellurite resistance protein B-like protein